MIVALTREPARSLEACELTYLERRPIDPARAAVQRRAYREALEACGAQFMRTAEMLSRRGREVRAVDVSEFAKAEAGLTCMSLLFHD